MGATSKETPVQIRAALDRYALQLQADGRSPHTVAQARRVIGALATWLEASGVPADIERLGHEDLARYLASPAAQRRPDGRARKASSGNATRTVMRTFFRYAADAGYTPANVARLVRLARTGAPPPRTLTDEEVRRLLAAVDAQDTPASRRDAALIRLLLGTGLRISSALALRPRDLDLEAGEIHVLSVKGGQPLVLPISRVVARELRAYLRTLPKDTVLLFNGSPGRPLTRRQAAKRLEKWAKAAGLGGRATCHGCRHTFATGLYRRTRDILVVQAALGHASVESSAIYARVDRAGLRAALRA